MRVCLLFLALLAAAPAHLRAQPLADTLFSWRGYARTATCELAIYPAPPDEDRTRTVVVRQLARSRGPSTVDDAQHLAELVGRAYGIDPAAAYWIFHWGVFSYQGAEAGPELFLRATFRRTDAGRLSSPYWRVISKNELRALTDRRYRD